MRLKEMRTAKGLGQKDVARVLDCSVQVYSRYETGDREPSIDTLIRLADFYCVSIDQLVGRTPMEIEIKKETPPPSGEDEYEVVILPQEDPTPDLLEQKILQVVTREFEKRGL